jgi:protein-tyrosine-phosphatase
MKALPKGRGDLLETLHEKVLKLHELQPFDEPTDGSHRGPEVVFEMIRREIAEILDQLEKTK